MYIHLKFFYELIAYVMSGMGASGSLYLFT